MKEDYLWDKSGAADPEIERLENALAVFRYQETDAPALPAKIIPFETKQPRGFFRLAFAFATCAAVVIITFTVWFHFSSGKVEVAEDSTKIIVPRFIEKVSDETLPEKPVVLTVKTIEPPKQTVERNGVKIRKSVPVMARKNVTIARQVETKKSTITLTKEEKYAYDQLMLALSVTSSTFKKVKDKVESVEEKPVVRPGGR